MARAITSANGGMLEPDQDRLFHYAAFVRGSYHWMLDRNKKTDHPIMCDDARASLVAVKSGDFWKVFVR